MTSKRIRLDPFFRALPISGIVLIALEEAVSAQVAAGEVRVIVGVVINHSSGKTRLLIHHPAHNEVRIVGLSEKVIRSNSTALHTPLLLARILAVAFLSVDLAHTPSLERCFTHLALFAGLALLGTTEVRGGIGIGIRVIEVKVLVIVVVIVVVVVVETERHVQLATEVTD